MREFEIHTASPENLRDLSLLWLEFIQDDIGSDLNIVPNKENAERWIKFVRSLMHKNRGAIKYATLSGEIVGYVLYRWEENALILYKRKGTILDLYVKRSYRGKGIGTKLLEEALNDLKRRGLDFVQLNVIASNEMAINLYKKFGFEEYFKVMRRDF